MRLTDFWDRMDQVFDPTYTRSWADDFVLPELGGLTVNQAITSGVETKEIWRAVCVNVAVPSHLR